MILQDQITALECELGASRAELLSLRHSLQIQEQMQDKLRTTLEKKVARLNATISATQIELTRAKLRAAALEEEMERRDSETKRRMQIHMPHSARAAVQHSSVGSGGIVGAGSLVNVSGGHGNPFAEYSTEAHQGSSGASSRSGSFSATSGPALAGGSVGRGSGGDSARSTHFVSPPSSRPASSSPTDQAAPDLQLEALNLSSGSDGSAAEL